MSYTGLWVQCDICDAWQQADCVGYSADGKSIKSSEASQKHIKKKNTTTVVERDGKYICQLCSELIQATTFPVATGATLIICPAPIMLQWHAEILRYILCLNYFAFANLSTVRECIKVHNHTRAGSLKTCIYEGVRETSFSNVSEIDISELVSTDIVLTTYDVLKDDLSHDSDRHEGDRRLMRFHKRYPVVPTVLTRIFWWRVCLDEAQMVENNAAAATERAMQLYAKHRWCITGTPIQRYLMTYMDFYDFSMPAHLMVLGGGLKLYKIHMRSTHHARRGRKASEHTVEASPSLLPPSSRKLWASFSATVPHDYGGNTDGKTKVEGEEALRRSVVALNGLAGIAILEQHFIQAMSLDRKDLSTVWWLEALLHAEKNTDLSRDLIRKIDEALVTTLNNGRSLRIASRFRSISGLKYHMQTGLDQLAASRKVLLDRLLEIDQTMEKPKEEDIHREYEARLFRREKAGGGTATCAEEAVALQKNSELNRFYQNLSQPHKDSTSSNSNKESKKRDAGKAVVSKSPSELEVVLGVIRNHCKAQLGRDGISESTKHLHILEGLVQAKQKVPLESPNPSSVAEGAVTIPTSTEQKNGCIPTGDKETCPVCQDPLIIRKMVFPCGHLTCCKCPTCRQHSDVGNIAHADDGQSETCASSVLHTTESREMSEASVVVQGSYGTKVKDTVEESIYKLNKSRNSTAFIGNKKNQDQPFFTLKDIESLFATVPPQAPETNEKPTEIPDENPMESLRHLPPYVAAAIAAEKRRKEQHASSSLP
ncbi:E3 ubiquitin-protein ligase SHPRH-like [Pyrus ussuriensis x Pyrus communis]|uniref:E3 ubiquitin-protein ligase SHPRH-like n=1 Tax=Pyrus ussuriensis x Pyrus communis TaxID=2448454 RepID=A0A5N5F5F4_9ROSA|nr:E3 ubiquitin-protein ligase SHPRH-like [Pyrus ussuriensis x Pyrus communis]